MKEVKAHLSPHDDRLAWEVDVSELRAIGEAYLGAVVRRALSQKPARAGMAWLLCYVLAHSDLSEREQDEIVGQCGR